MAEPVVLIHGYSSEGTTDDSRDLSYSDIAAIYGKLPERLAAMNIPVIPIDVSRWISLDDGVSIDDISLGFERAIRSREHRDDLKGGFNAIIHSTGALVMRNWVRRHVKPGGRDFRLKRLIHLAGANWGSGWAHIGQSQVSRFFRMVQGARPGQKVLEALELGSDWAIDLHTHFLENGRKMLEDYGVLEFCIIGTETPPNPLYLLAPMRYAKEDGADGVVRVSAGNLNWQYIEIGPTQRLNAMSPSTVEDYWTAKTVFDPEVTIDIKNLENYRGFEKGLYKVIRESKPDDGDRKLDSKGNKEPVSVAPCYMRRRIPFLIPPNTCHGDDHTGIVSGADNAAVTTEAIKEALTTEIAGYDALADKWETRTENTYNLYAAPPSRKKGFFEGLKDLAGDLRDAIKNSFDEPRRQFDKHAQVVVRVRDQNGDPVNDFNIYFNSVGGERGPGILINELFEDKHKCGKSPNCINFYLRLNTFDPKIGWPSQLEKVNGVDLEIDATDPASDRVFYLPVRFRISNLNLLKWIQPHRTTVLDVTMIRLPKDQVMVVKKPGT